MTRYAMSCIFLMMASGCIDSHRYEINLSKIHNFDWDGKVIIQDRDYGFFVGWKTEKVQLASTDGRIITIDPNSQDMQITVAGNAAHAAQERVKIHTQSLAGLTVWGDHVEVRRLKYQTVGHVPTTQPATVPTSQVAADR